MDDREKLLERIRKLLALSKSSNIHEAELAMAKVNELLTEHQIAMSDVLIKEVSTMKAVKGNHHRVSETYRSFIATIAIAAGTLFDTRVLTQGQSGIRFVGLPEDITASEIMFDYLFDSWKSIVAHDTRKYKEQFPSYALGQYDIKKYKIGHGQGFSHTVNSRAAQLAYERKKSVAASTGNQLVVLKHQLIEDVIKDIPEANNRYKIQGIGFREGVERGKAIPLSGALTKDKQDLL